MDWRAFRGILAALLILAFAAGPGLDQMVCGDEAAAAAQAHAGPQPPCDDAHADGEERDSHGACHHGHCHHGGGFAPSPLQAASLQHARKLALSPSAATGEPSGRQFGLMRPPRA